MDIWKYLTLICWHLTKLVAVFSVLVLVDGPDELPLPLSPSPHRLHEHTQTPNQVLRDTQPCTFMSVYTLPDFTTTSTHTFSLRSISILWLENESTDSLSSLQPLPLFFSAAHFSLLISVIPFFLVSIARLLFFFLFRYSTFLLSVPCHSFFSSPPPAPFSCPPLTQFFHQFFSLSPLCFPILPNSHLPTGPTYAHLIKQSSFPIHKKLLALCRGCTHCQVVLSGRYLYACLNASLIIGLPALQRVHLTCAHIIRNFMPDDFSGMYGTHTCFLFWQKYLGISCLSFNTYCLQILKIIL